MRDRAQVGDELVVAHSDAGVANHELFLVLAPFDHDLERRLIPVRFVGQRHIPHLVERIRRVGDQLADGDLRALIQRVR